MIIKGGGVGSLLPVGVETFVQLSLPTVRSIDSGVLGGGSLSVGFRSDIQTKGLFGLYNLMRYSLRRR